MKTVKSVAAIVMAGTFLVAAVSCAAAGAKAGTDNASVSTTEQVTALTVSGNGNIKAGTDIKLSFELAGKVNKMDVAEGDMVEKGQLLAELDTSSLDLALNNARSAYNAALVNYHQAQAQVSQNEMAIENAEIALAQAVTALHQAEYNLAQTREFSTWSDINAAEGEIADAQELLSYSLSKLNIAPPGSESEKTWQKAVFFAQTRLNTAKQRYDAMLAGTDTEEIQIKQEQVESATRSVSAAELSLEYAKESLERSIESLEVAEGSLALGEQAVRMAEAKFDKAILVAPYDAVVASVNIEEQSIVSPGMVVIHLVDMNSLELSVEVDEIDVPLVKAGQPAVIKIDALPQSELNGTVSSIGLLPAQETGLIMYEVTITFDEPSQDLKVGMSSTATITVSE